MSKTKKVGQTKIYEGQLKDYYQSLGATSIDKISEVWLSDEIGEGGFEILFSSVGPFFEEWGGGLENFGQKLKFFGFFQLRSPLI